MQRRSLCLLLLVVLGVSIANDVFTAAQVCSLNGLTNCDAIDIGQVLRLPCPSSTPSTSTTGSASTGSTSSSSGTTTVFHHPGILVGIGQLNFIKTSVQNKVEPMYTAYTKALSSSLGSKTYSAKGPRYSNIACGSYSDPNNGCSDDDDDSTAAYLQALLWYITGDTTYANNAIRLMNAYSSTVTTFSLSNAPLQAAWSAEKWPRAAEIIKYTSTLWSDSDFTKFKNWLRNVHLPLIQGGSSSSNGNWELSMIEGTMNIAVLTDDQTLFNNAVNMWRARVPSYFYISTDGTKPKPAPRGTSAWYTQTTFNANVNGICQETCRDLGHTQYGLSATLNAAATAITQGVDLFTEQQTRLVDAMEFNANFLNGASVPSYVCAGHVDAGTKYTTWELGYNHYHNKGGISMPNTLAFINNYVRKQSSLTDSHISVWETLTNGGAP